MWCPALGGVARVPSCTARVRAQEEMLRIQLVRRSLQLALERIIGTTSMGNSAFQVNHITGDVATAAGCIAAMYNPSAHRQTRFFRAPQPITSLCFSQDGAFLAAGQKGRQASISVWSVSTGMLVAQLAEHTYGVAALAFSPDGEFLVSVGFRNDRALQVWRWKAPTRAGGMVRVASGKLSQKVNALAFASNGASFITAGEKHLKFWSMEPLLAAAASGAPPGTTAPVLLSSRPAVVSEAGPEFELFVDVACGVGANANCVYALSSAGMLCCFDGEERIMEQWVNVKVARAYSLDVSANVLLVGASDGIVRMFTPGSLVFTGMLPLPPAVGALNVNVTQAVPQPKPLDVFPAAVAVRAAAAGRFILVLYGDKSLFVWDVRDAERIIKYRSCIAHAGPIWDIAMVPASDTQPSIGAGESVLLSPSSATPSLLSPAGAMLSPKQGLLSASQAPPLPADIYPSGTFVTCSTDCTLRFWNLNPRATGTRKDMETAGSGGAPLLAVAAPPGPAAGSVSDGGGGGGGSDSAGASAPKPLWPRNMFMRELLNVLYVDDEDAPHDEHDDATGGRCRVVASSWPARCIITTGAIDSENGMNYAALMDIGVRSLAVAPSAAQVACGDRQGNVRIFDLRSSRLSQYEVAHDAEIMCMAYSPCSGRLLATGSRDRLVHVFDAMAASHPYDVVTTLADHGAGLTSLQFSKNDNQLIAAGGDGSILFYSLSANPSSGEVSVDKAKAVSQGTGAVYGMAVDCANKTLVTVGQDRRVNVWAMRNRRFMRSFKADDDGKELHRVVFDPSGLFVATASIDRVLRIHDFFTGHCLARTTGHSEAISGMVFTPDCRRLITVSGDGCIFVWHLSAVIIKSMQDRLREIGRARAGAAAGSATSSTVAPTPLATSALSSAPWGHHAADVTAAAPATSLPGASGAPLPHADSGHALTPASALLPPPTRATSAFDTSISAAPPLPPAVSAPPRAGVPPPTVPLGAGSTRSVLAAGGCVPVIPPPVVV
ncbi:hypothetical protein EON62_00600, partial [archaeon]